MFSNPKTTIFGALTIAAVIAKVFFPEFAALIDQLTGVIVGSGLVAAADAANAGAKLPKV